MGNAQCLDSQDVHRCDGVAAWVAGGLGASCCRSPSAHAKTRDTICANRVTVITVYSISCLTGRTRRWVILMAPRHVPSSVVMTAWVSVTCEHVRRLLSRSAP